MTLSAKAGTIWDGGKSANSGIVTIFNTLWYSSVVSLFFGSGLIVVVLLSAWISPYSNHLSYVLLLIPATSHAVRSLEPLL